MSARRILGVDPGTRCAGYAIVDDGVGPAACRYVECGVIDTPKERDVGFRVGVVAQSVAEIISEFGPNVLALEKAYYGRNAGSALKLGQVRGAIMLVATQAQVPVFEYAPARIKRVVAGHGRATKQQIQQRVQMIFRLHRTPTTDAADALAIALCHAQSTTPGVA